MAGLAAYVFVGGFIWLACRSIYRLYFHPLSGFPGPKLAAITSGYECYFNVVKRGSFIWELQRLHEVYGPIVRVTPREIHIKDSEYYDEIYAGSTRKREKDAVTVRQFDLDGSAFSAITSEVHRERRSAMSPFFSKSAISSAEDDIKKRLDQLHDHLERAQKSDRVVLLDAGFSALTSDVINKYAFGYHSGNLEHDDFNETLRDGFVALFKSAHHAYFFPILPAIIGSLPLDWLKALNPFAHALAMQKDGIRQRVKKFLTGHSSGDGCIMEKLCSPSMPAHMLDVERLTDEGFAMAIAGTETTARSLSIGAFHLYTDDRVRAKLREELQSVMPTSDSCPSWKQLEQLPYLSGVVYESMRLSTGIASRSPRVAPTEALVYNDTQNNKEYIIPPGTLISETNYFVLNDPLLFPNPEVFEPERWMRASAKGERLDRYLVNFSRGSRICLGMNLAYAELYMTFATLVRRFDLECQEGAAKHVAFVRDFGTPYPDEGNLSLPVKVTASYE
ncbi:hypothetical protein PENSTE_c032G03956 [Penicillium steckii]|uniref:Cytochrome P450 n=1 Tax=Penicillium steckii TaxID=303698 RepID=A0A1V6SLD2_9EURO|nr:hypothetical protein PENSTE_c032G03956 [Penicillium steckii]